MVSHTGSDLVLDEALQSIQFGFFLWISNHTVQGSRRVQPDWTHFPHLMDDEQEPIRNQQHRLIQRSVKWSTHIDRKSVCDVCWRFGHQEDFRTRTFGEPKPGNTETLSDVGRWSLTPNPNPNPDRHSGGSPIKLLIFDKLWGWTWVWYRTGICLVLLITVETYWGLHHMYLGCWRGSTVIYRDQFESTRTCRHILPTRTNLHLHVWSI